MPKGDREILKADPEDGTTPIANLLLEALAIARLSGKEKGIILYLWRRTYGWEKDGKRLKEKTISLSEFGKVCDSDTATVSKLLSGLVKRNILKRKFAGPGKGYSYSMNTRVGEWDKGCINHQLLKELSIQPLSKSSTQGLSKNTTPLDTNLATPKESIKKVKEIYIELFNLWNDLRIIIHKKLTGDMKQAIDSARKDYSQEEIGQAMQNYAVIVKGPEYYFDHRWTLADFLSRRHSNNIERFQDLEIAKSNFKKEADRGADKRSATKLIPRQKYTPP
ncbi:hypothetical protein ES703_108889 [subsurface metagenome]